jgi:methylenetetrahydrofolate reductase (NADPH)
LAGPVVFSGAGDPDSLRSQPAQAWDGRERPVTIPAMKIDRILETSRPCFSFEFFPPKTPEGEERLFETIAALRRLEPSFVSVTYGAGGGTRALTVDIVKRMKNELGIEAMAHFTCVGHTSEELHEVLREMRNAGIENVLALRGDPPKGETEFRPAPGGLSHGSELAALISESYDFCVGGACYPETHPEALDPESDLRTLHYKVSAGCAFLITQLFFDNRDYFDFVERARATGVEVPIVAGIMPITNFEQIKRFTSMCGATIPPGLHEQLEAAAAEGDEAVVDLGIAYATQQCADLLARGAPGIHFYTLNKSTATRTILSALKAARPWERRLASVPAGAHPAT